MKYKVGDIVYGIKGLILGFQQGLLNDERIRLSDECFTSLETSQDLKFLAEFAQKKRSIWDVYEFTKTSTDMIMEEFDNCNWTSTIDLLQAYCYENSDDTGIETQEFTADWRSAKTRCSQSKMIENFYMRFFNFQGSYKRVMDVVRSWDTDNRNDVYLQSMAIGRECGKMTRILYDFHLTDESKLMVTN